MIKNDPKNKVYKDLLKIILWNKNISHNLRVKLIESIKQQLVP